MFVRTVGIALAAGIAAAVVWWIATVTVGRELSWLCCAIGLAAGLAVRRWGENRERSVELAAVLLVTVAVIMGTRHLVVSGLAEQRFAGLRSQLVVADEETMVATVADEIAQERVRANLPVNWPEGMTYEDALVEEDYPADLWAEAKQRWSGFAKSEQQRRTVEHERKLNALANGLQQKLASNDIAGLYRFRSLGWPLAGLCIALGCMTFGHKD